MITITITYKFKGRTLISTSTTDDESFIPDWVEIACEEIEQEIREAILDECLGWEKALKVEHSILSHFEKHKVITITHTHK
jgi:hypothetical protein